MKSRIVPLHQLTGDDIAAWQRLAQECSNPNPLFEPSCLIPSAQHLIHGDEFLLVIAEEGGVFFGCLPLMRVASKVRPSNSWAGVRRRVYSSQLRRLRYDGTPLLRASRGVEAVSAILGELRARATMGAPAILVLEAVDLDGVAARYLIEAAAALGAPCYQYRTWVRPVVRRREEPSYRHLSGGKSDQKLAKLRRQLGRELGGDVRVVERHDDPSAIEQLLQLEAAGYKSLLRVDMNSHVGEPQWFREMCAAFRAERRLSLYSLQVEDCVVAMNLLVRGGDCLFGLQTVFDERYAKYSPGLQLEVDVIDRFHHDTDAMLLDSCTFEGNETMLQIYPDRRQVATFILAVGGRGTRLYLRAAMTVNQILGDQSALRRRWPRLYHFVNSAATRVLLPRRAAQVTHPEE